MVPRPRSCRARRSRCGTWRRCGRASRSAGWRCVIPAPARAAAKPIDAASRISRRAARVTRRCPPSTPLSQPYWLREEHAGHVRGRRPALIGRPENPPRVPGRAVFEVGGQTLAIADEPRAGRGARRGAEPRRLEVIPPVSLRFLVGRPAVRAGLRAPGGGRGHAPRAHDAAGTLRPGCAGGLEGRARRRGRSGSRPSATCEAVTFTVTAPSQPATADITARADDRGRQPATTGAS